MKASLKSMPDRGMFKEIVSLSFQQLGVITVVLKHEEFLIYKLLFLNFFLNSVSRNRTR